MALSVVITLTLISAISAHSPASNVARRQLDNGDWVFYVRGAGDKSSVASIAHYYKNLPTPLEVTETTDGVQTTVKKVHSRGELLDCDVRLNAQMASRLVDEVETNIEQLTASQNHNGTMPRAVQEQLLADVRLQAAQCENFLQTRADAEGVQQSRLPQSIPIELEDQEQEQDDGVEPEEVGKKRQKRGYLIWPGTNWCGKGSKAEFAESYGEHAETDKCCQKHDQCPYIIEGFTTKYSLFNYRMHTLSICDCDEKFMDCLKSANTSTAVMIGKVFFNVLTTECFDLKLQKSCAKRSWWGGCEKYTTKWTATIRSLGDFPEK